MTDPDSRALNADLPEVETMRRLLAEAERVSRELGELADEMVARSEAGRREARELIASLTAAMDALAGEGVEGPVEPPEAKEPAKPAEPGSDGARMLARQMLANGADSEAVERTLQTSFGVKDAGAVVASILTPGK